MSDRKLDCFCVKCGNLIVVPMVHENTTLAEEWVPHLLEGECWQEYYALLGRMGQIIAAKALTDERRQVKENEG